MVTIIRRIGLALGSLVIAWLAVLLVAGLLIGPAASENPVVWLVAVAVGAGVYLDILRRERPVV